MEQSDSMRFLWVKQADVFNDGGEFEVLRVFACIYFDLLSSLVVFKLKNISVIVLFISEQHLNVYLDKFQEFWSLFISLC